MRESEISNKTKLKDLKTTYKLYEQFLKKGFTNEKQRIKLTTEMGRISDMIYKLERLPIKDILKKYDEYHREFVSGRKYNLKVA